MIYFFAVGGLLSSVLKKKFFPHKGGLCKYGHIFIYLYIQYINHYNHILKLILFTIYTHPPLLTHETFINYSIFYIIVKTIINYSSQQEHLEQFHIQQN